MSSEVYNVGDKLVLVKGKEGIILYKGELHDRKGIYYGVEVTLGKGKHSGLYKDKQYFKCAKKQGLFVEDKHIISKIIEHNETKKSKKSKSKKNGKSKSKTKSKSTEIHIDSDQIKSKKDKKSKSKNKTKGSNDAEIDWNKNIVPKKLSKSKSKSTETDNIAPKKLSKFKSKSVDTDNTLSVKSKKEKKDKKHKKKASNDDIEPEDMDSLKPKKNKKHKRQASFDDDEESENTDSLKPKKNRKHQRQASFDDDEPEETDSFKPKKDKKDKKRKSKKHKTALEVAADEAWGSPEDEKQEDHTPEILPEESLMLTPRYSSSKDKKRKSKKVKQPIVYSIPSIIADKKDKKKYTKKVEIVDGLYMIEERFLHKRNSLNITSNGKLVCNPWNPETNKKGGIIRIQCNTEIIIEKDGIITASNRGWFGKYGHGMAQKLRHYDIYGGASYGSEGQDYYDHNTKSMLNKGKTYGNKQLIKLYPGTGNKYLRGGGIIELVAPSIINEGIIECNGGGGCSGGSIFICCDTFINNGSITASGGKQCSFCGKAGNGRIAIYCNEYENNGTISPKPYRYSLTEHVDKNKKKKKKKGITEDIKEEENKESASVYDYGTNIVQNRENIKMNVSYKANMKRKFQLNNDEKKDPEKVKTERECKKALDSIINMLIKYGDKISDANKEIYAILGIKEDIIAILGTEIGFEIMQKHRKLFIKTTYRERMVCDRLIVELKFVRLLGSLQFMEFSVINKVTIDPFDTQTMATMRYTNGRIEPFNDILPRICWRLSYEYLNKKEKIVKVKSDFKFREKSLETKIALWEFEGKEIQRYEILVKVDRTKDKYESVLKNTAFADHKTVNIASGFILQSDKLRRCGFLRIEKMGKLYPKAWYSDTKEGGNITIECIDLVCFGAIDVSCKGQYGKYGKGAGKKKKDKKKKSKHTDNDYYVGGAYVGNSKLEQLVFGCGIANKKHFKGGGTVDLYIKDQFINYGIISSDGSLSSSGGSIFICCKLFINYGVIQCCGGKEIAHKSGKGTEGKIAIYTKIFENYGTITPYNNVYIGSFEEGIQIFKKRQNAIAKNK